MQYPIQTPVQLGSFLRTRREAFGLTQKQAALRIGLLPKTISALENDPLARQGGCSSRGYAGMRNQILRFLPQEGECPHAAVIAPLHRAGLLVLPCLQYSRILVPVVSHSSLVKQCLKAGYGFLVFLDCLSERIGKLIIHGMDEMVGVGEIALLHHFNALLKQIGILYRIGQRKVEQACLMLAFLPSEHPSHTLDPLSLFARGGEDDAHIGGGNVQALVEGFAGDKDSGFPAAILFKSQCSFDIPHLAMIVHHFFGISALEPLIQLLALRYSLAEDDDLACMVQKTDEIEDAIEALWCQVDYRPTLMIEGNQKPCQICNRFIFAGT